MAFTLFRELNKSPPRRESLAFSVEDSPLDYSPGGFCDESVWREFKGIGGGWNLEEEVKRRRREGESGG
jgi:hypothetical protein